ncbi:hypothetical protein E6C27_scaffold339G00840 [Cucumis melo var. makuwa]|uniref:Uncharacterized protein n=1 Tax=Cucumis melo var. makuwa TaxID=1194695 RepID=A0A5A7UYI1_CUCMM|nr:hypothetical protein E6C27_scaffold339G00840 [Cucumis melo var. makuwa]
MEGKEEEGYKMALSSVIFCSVEALEIRCYRSLKPDINHSTNFRRDIQYNHRGSSSPSTVAKNFITIFSNSVDCLNDDFLPPELRTESSSGQVVVLYRFSSLCFLKSVPWTGAGIGFAFG